jgi:uncharacterized protein YndB with AHSA1/START domain
MAVQDRIERVVTLPVSRDRAWRAITDRAEVSRWFMPCSVLELRPGADILFEGARGRIEAVEPPRRFAYSWHPGSEQHLEMPLAELTLTLVEFILDETPEGTRLTLIESGFASLPAEMYDRALRENTDGWAEVISGLVTYIEALERVS